MDIKIKQEVLLCVNDNEKQVIEVALSEEVTEAYLNLLKYLNDENFDTVIFHLCKYMQGYIKGKNAHKRDD